MSAETVSKNPIFSVIVPTHNDWGPLAGCLDSLSKQRGNPAFEVIVVDDGSRDEASKLILQYGHFFPLTVIRQAHTGIASARNQGVQNSKGAIIIFTDADCRLDRACLATLNEKVAGELEHNYFQLRLTGDSSNLLGRAEDLRLSTTQNHLLQSDGRIRYLNTSGFAVRKSALDSKDRLFDPIALRSEDTLLLMNLIQKGELPLFIADAVVRHTVQMSFAECIAKDLRVAWLEAKTFERIAAQGVHMRMSNRERLAVLRSTWAASETPSIGRSAWFALTFRQALQRLISVIYRLWTLISTWQES